LSNTYLRKYEHLLKLVKKKWYAKYTNELGDMQRLNQSHSLPRDWFYIDEHVLYNLFSFIPEFKKIRVRWSAMRFEKIAPLM
jgi:hypothetical protein